MDAITSVNNNSFTQASNKASALGGSQKTLGQDEFLELLVTQLTNQDPLEPVSDTDFIAQMAQFSALEQQSQLNETMGQFVVEQQKSMVQTYLGKEVSISTENGTVRGLVSEVTVGNSGNRVVVNGFDYDPKFITSIAEPNLTTN